MPDFKIIGNPHPVVGKEEFYSVNTFLPNILPFQKQASESSFELPVKWEVYVLEHGRWRKTKENDKTGKRISYTFLQKSLTRKGIRILARRGEDVARLNITPHPSEKPKIESIELLDKSGKKPAQPLSYGQTLKARVHCLHMERHKIYVTLWEDDAIGAGHNKANEKNIIQTLSGVVKNGKADIDFLLKLSFAKIANKSRDEGNIHEYYVTADFNNDKIASNNVNVNDFETPVVPFKGKTTPKEAEKSSTSSKKDSPKQDASGAKKEKGRINSVNLTDTAGNKIKGTFREKQIKVWINSTGLKGKDISLKLYDEDVASNDLLFQQEFILKSDLHAIVVPLDTIPRSLGGNFWTEGAEQELFAEVKVLQTNDLKKSAVVDVDAKVFKPDPVEQTNKTAKVGEGGKNEGKSCGEKFCIKKGSPDSELIREINIRLAGFGGNVPTDKFTDRTEKMIKQFQRDYMKVPETGKICGNVLQAIDDFSKKFDITTRFWNQMKCDCIKKGQITTSKLRGIRETNSCSGFGDHTGKLTYKATPHNEANHNYEYPGIHRSLLFGVKALQFYFSKQTVYTMDQVTSGYRCRFKNYKTTNHQGKAIDIQFSKNGAEIRGPIRANLQKLRDIRDEFYIKYLGAQEEWPNKNLFSVEPIDLLYYPDGSLRYDHTFSWLHIDVRQFESIYLEDNYFCKSLIDLNGKSIVQLAREAGFENTCKCFNAYANNTPTNSSKKSFSCEDKFKKVASIILKHEGGYVNHPSDKGGATNKGITLSTWKKYAMSDTNNEPTLENLKKLTDEDATKIYRKRYWEPKGFCNINDERVSLMVYDWTITSGGAIKQVQKLLIKEFSQKITIDGEIGNQTVTAINSVKDQDKLLKRLSEIRKKYYTDLTYTDGEKNDQDVFLKGWLDRVDDCLKFNP